MLENINITDLKLLSSFVPDYASFYSIRDMVARLKINYSYAFHRVKFLVKNGFFIEKKGRHSSQISFNIHNLSAVKLLCFVEEQMSEGFEIIKFKRIILEISLADPFACIGLFGSRASGKAKRDSDWDIFIITCKEKEVSKLCKSLYSLNKDVQFQVFSLDEFRDSLRSNEETVVRYIVRNKKILYNPHPFYSIIYDWEKVKYAPSQTD